MNVLTSDPLLEFITSNHAFWARQPASTLAAYLAWHRNRGLLATSLVGEDVVGICTIRIFAHLEDFLIPWIFYPFGQFLMVDLLVAASPLAMADCFDQLASNWGPRPIVIWERGDRTVETAKAPRIYRWDQFMKLSRRLTYGAIGD